MERSTRGVMEGVQMRERRVRVMEERKILRKSAGGGGGGAEIEAYEYGSLKLQTSYHSCQTRH